MKIWVGRISLIQISRILKPLKSNRSLEVLISVSIISLCSYPILFHSEALYSNTTAILLILTFLTFLLKVKWLLSFYRTFAIILLPFFLINGILTGWLLEAPIVNYNNAENLGLRLNTIPVEDVFYGMLLLIISTTIYEFFLKKIT